jgi:hypothetical protein
VKTEPVATTKTQLFDLFLPPENALWHTSCAKASSWLYFIFREQQEKGFTVSSSNLALNTEGCAAVTLCLLLHNFEDTAQVAAVSRT